MLFRFSRATTAERVNPLSWPRKTLTDAVARPLPPLAPWAGPARRLALALAAGLLLAACAGTSVRDSALDPDRPGAEHPVPAGAKAAPAVQPRATYSVAAAPVPRLVTGERWVIGDDAPTARPSASATPESTEGQSAGEEGWVVQGTGRFVRPATRGAAPERAAGDITLNFENTDIREVVKVILGDLLGLSYILDPAVQGASTLQTGRPLARDDLLPTLETLLRMNAAVLVYSDDVYRVLPSASAARGTLVPQLGDNQAALPTGFKLKVVPLRYVSAVEMEKILNPLVPEGSIVRVDGPRNLLILAGTGPELENLLDTIEIFDVHWLKGMSVGFFPLEFIEIDDLMKDLDAVFGEQAESPLAGVLRLVPIASANGLLVVSQNPEYLDEVQGWIRRFDRPSAAGGDTPRLYIYRVKNGEAVELADILSNLFSDDGGARSRAPSASLAPGLAPVTLKSDTQDEQARKPAAPRAVATLGPKTGEPGSADLASEIKVVADEVNNSLLILATPRDYDKIRSALEKLDIVPLQVLIEATILEVTLGDSFNFGLEWAFRFGNTSTVALNDGSLTSGEGGILSALASGFSWTFVSGSADVAAVVKAVQSETAVKLLSSPSMMVLDNQTASIDVGDEIPTLSQSQTSTESGAITNSIQYRKTGVQLQVTPRVNPGGLVIMEVNENVSNQAGSGIGGSPIIQNREIKSTVAVQSGQVVVLGGLIREASDKSRRGIPGLYRLPVIGWAFGQTGESVGRTELVVILAPRVISNRADADLVVEDFRKRLKGLEKRF